METGLNGLGFPVDLLLYHVSYSDSCLHLPCEAKHPTTNVEQAHICIFPCCPSAWLEITTISAELFPFALQNLS